MVWPVNPWRKALREERCLPASVRGPVDFWVFALLTAARWMARLMGSGPAARSRPLGWGTPLGVFESDMLFHLNSDLTCVGEELRGGSWEVGEGEGKKSFIGG